MIETPKDKGAELAMAIAKGVVSAVPFAGGLLAEVGSLYLNPVEARKRRWMEEISEALNELRQELDVLPEQLQGNDRFISTLYHATEIAIRNHQETKLRALRNALVSSAHV